MFINRFKIYKNNLYNIVDTMFQCSICIEDIEKNKLYKTVCGHYFHKECIYEWLENCKKECPLCRTKQIFPNVIRFKKDYKVNYFYTFDLFKFCNKSDDETFIFNDIEYNFPIQQLKEQIPCGWINNSELITSYDNLLPVYKLYNDDGTKELYIDFHLRQLFLRKNKIKLSKITKNINVKDNTYFLSTNQHIYIYPRYKINPISKSINTTLTLWIYDVMFELKVDKIISNYDLSINSLILDITFVTIYMLSYQTDKFQLATMCSIYSCLKLYNKKTLIDINHINNYTVNLYSIEQIKRTLQVQSMIISSYVELI